MSAPEPERCPQCGGERLSFGYGFAGGGGIGEYTFCLDCDCLITKHVTDLGQLPARGGAAVSDPDNVLTIWVIYRNPSDYPGQYVLRGQDVVRGESEPRPHRECIVRPTLDEVRQYVRHLYRMDRDPLDDPTIVETWI